VLVFLGRTRHSFDSFVSSADVLGGRKDHLNDRNEEDARQHDSTRHGLIVAGPETRETWVTER
jgi:hypothetical protein